MENQYNSLGDLKQTFKRNITLKELKQTLCESYVLP